MAGSWNASPFWLKATFAVTFLTSVTGLVGTVLGWQAAEAANVRADAAEERARAESARETEDAERRRLLDDLDVLADKFATKRALLDELAAKGNATAALEDRFDAALAERDAATTALQARDYRQANASLGSAHRLLDGIRRDGGLDRIDGTPAIAGPLVAAASIVAALLVRRRA